MHEHTAAEDHGEWLSVRISREAMEDHFGADAFESLVYAYRHHAEQIRLRVAPLAGQTPTFTRENPLVVHTKDL